jgi:hypothetical protein
MTRPNKIRAAAVTTTIRITRQLSRFTIGSFAHISFAGKMAATFVLWPVRRCRATLIAFETWGIVLAGSLSITA